DKLVPLCRRAVVAWERSKTESWRIGLDGLKFIRIILAAALFPNIDGHDDVSKREGTATRVNLEESGVACDGSPKVSNSSPLISHTATINMPRRLYNVDVAATFEVPLTIVVNLHMLINGIESGKHDVLLSGMTNDERMAIMDALVDINIKSTSYFGVAGASAKDQPKFNSNFHPLVDDLVFDGVNISIPRKVVEKENWAKHGLKRIMMNSKGFFFFKFDSYASLEAVLEGGPWLVRNSSIILKKWSMDTRLLKEELTRIFIWLKFHDIPIQVFEEDEADLVDVVTIGIPSLTGDGFTKETIRVKYEWKPPKCDIYHNLFLSLNAEEEVDEVVE
ncbi:zinc knuckle CX2CX4HX4C containing protein, partial [Tanacetum coccineum]